MPPRLNNFGYAFLKAGYRLRTGVDNKLVTLTNVATVMADVHLEDTNPGGSTGFDLSTTELQLATSLVDTLAFHFHFIFSSQSEAQSGFAEAFVRYNTAATGRFFHAQLGQIPVITGFKLGGAREATITPSMWLGQGVGPLTGNGQGNLNLGGLQRGAEVGYNVGGFDAKASLLNGVNEAGQGDVGLQGHRLNDYVLQAEELIGKEGSSLGGFYYKGKTPLVSVGFDDSFYRAGVVASFTRILKAGEGQTPDLSLDVNGGLFWGHDKFLGGSGGGASSTGSIAELDVYHKNASALIVRYDAMKPSPDLGTTSAFTLAVAHRPGPYYRLEAEYRKQMRPGAESIIGSLWFFY